MKSNDTAVKIKVSTGMAEYCCVVMGLLCGGSVVRSCVGELKTAILHYICVQFMTSLNQ